MSHDPVTVGPEVTLAALINQIMLRHNISFVPVVEGPVLLGHIDQSILSSIDRENWANTRVGDVFVGLEEQSMVDPDLRIESLLELISQTGRRKFMVVRDHHLLGVITLSDLTSYLSQKAQM
jgi:CBS domain-containing protein